MNIMNDDVDRLMMAIQTFEMIYGSTFTLHVLEQVARDIQYDLETLEGEENGA